MSWTEEVLGFWLSLDPKQWWQPDEALDRETRRRFEQLWKSERQSPPALFLTDPRTALAAVILFDQLPRNMFRGHADQFASDELALAVAEGAVELGFDDQLSKVERGLLYLPWMHSEKLADQRRSVALYTALGDDFQLGFARKHQEIIERFGRFPHRNAMLGRAPRQAESEAGEVVPW